MRKLTCAVLAVLLFSCLLLPVHAAQQETLTPYIQRLINYYLYYQDKAETEIATLQDYISSVDPGQGALWKSIMDDWARNNSQLAVNRDILPDGLPQDDSLCIVVLGYGLKSDGSMKEELVDRLVVALASAMKYPNAYIAVTGGETSDVAGISEAGQMAAWLREKGVADSRLIVESRSLSTTENALNTCKILTASYPQVDSIAVISSDYHIPWGCTMFTTLAHYSEYRGEKAYALVGNAACTTSNTSDTLYSQAWGICVITGIPFDGSGVPAMYWVEETTYTETQPSVQPVPEEPEGDHSWMIFPAVMIAVSVVILLIPTKGKRRRPRK